jgi:predicted RNA-binding Zn ribbon-like protein
MAMKERIRGGGLMTPDGFRFELTGGNLALDLANTVVNRAAGEPRELLNSYADLLSWARQSGILDDKEERALRREADAHPIVAARVLDRAIEIRELLFALCSSAAPARELLQTLTALEHEALQHRHLGERDGAVRWSWSRERLDDILWPVIDAAAGLLVSDERNRVRTCQGDECRWLFIDNSRQGNRRWCDMTTCGNRAKAKRFYQKTKESQ